MLFIICISPQHIQLHHCGDLSENRTQMLINLDAWPAVDKCLGTIRKYDLIILVYHFEVLKAHAISS